MFEFCFKSVRNEKILLALQKKIVLVLLWDIINNKEVQQHMTNVITYIIIVEISTFVNILQVKINVKTYVLFKSENKYSILGVYKRINSFLFLNLWFENDPVSTLCAYIRIVILKTFLNNFVVVNSINSFTGRNV